MRMKTTGTPGLKTGTRVYFGNESTTYFVVVGRDWIDFYPEETWLAQAFFERWFRRGAAIAGAYWAFAWAASFFL